MKKIITTDNIDEIIGKEIDGTATHTEIEALLEWSHQSVENENYYQQLHEINVSYTSNAVPDINVLEDWDKLQNKINQKKKNKPEKKQILGIKKHLAYAASLVVLFCVGYLITQPSESINRQYTNHIGQEYELEDGSTIHLAANSAFSQIKEGKREYTLSGKATFEVEHSDINPFVVHIDDVRVRDLGTIFKIQAEPQNDTIFVKVTEGLVEFFSLSNDGIKLKIGEEGMFIKSQNRFYKRWINPQNLTFNVAFEDVTIGELVEHLAYTFRKEVAVVNEGLMECSITVDFTNASLDVVKEIIKETLNINIVEEGNKIIVSGNSCY